MRILIAIAILSLAPACRADSIPVVAADLEASVSVPFLSGVADDLAANLLTAQSLVAYASAQSLDLSIASVVRAIGIDAEPYVGWSADCPITWLQSTIAIDPGASLVITPLAINFGAYYVGAHDSPVATPEASAWLMLVAGIAVMLGVAILLGKVLKHRREELERAQPPVIMTPWGPVTEWARKQASFNIRNDANTRSLVTAAIRKELEGKREIVSDAEVEYEMRRRYPEAYEPEPAA